MQKVSVFKNLIRTTENKTEGSVVPYTPYCNDEKLDADFKEEKESWADKGKRFLNKPSVNKQKNKNKENEKKKALRKLIDLEIHTSSIAIKKWTVDNEKQLKRNANIYFFVFVIINIIFLGLIFFFCSSKIINFTYLIALFFVLFRSAKDLSCFKFQLNKMKNGNMSSLNISKKKIDFNKGIFKSKIVKKIFEKKINKGISNQNIDFLSSYEKLNDHWLKVIGIKSLFIQKRDIGYNLFSFLSLTYNIKNQIRKGKNKLF